MISRAIRNSDLSFLEKVFGENPNLAQSEIPFGTWLHYAATEGKLEIVQLLVEAFHADVNARGGACDGSAMNCAAGCGKYEVVQYLLNKGAVIDISEPTRNPLFGAILGGDVRIGELLIEHGIDTTVRYTGERMKDMDALAFARERGATEFVELLERVRQSDSANP